MKLRSKNILTTGLEKSSLTSAYAAGVTSIAVNNNDRFINNQKIMIGEMGHERTEIVTIGASVTPGTALTVSATVFAHDADTPVYVLKYDKVKFYRSTTGIAGTYTQLGADVVMDVDNVNLETIYDDTTGLSSYFYKVSFYGTYDSTETDLSDPIAGTGYDRGTVGFLLNEFFNEVSDTTQMNMTVDEAIGLLNEVNDDVISQSRRPYRFLKTSDLLDVVASTATVSLPTNLSKFDRLQYTNATDERTDTYRRISIQEMEMINSDNTLDADDDLIYFSIDESTNKLVLYPTPKTSASDILKIYYWKKFDEITGLADSLITPNPRIYKMFLMGRYYRKRAVKEPNYMSVSDRYLSDYNTEIVKLQRSNRLDMGTPMSMKPDAGYSRGLRRR